MFFYFYKCSSPVGVSISFVSSFKSNSLGGIISPEWTSIDGLGCLYSGTSLYSCSSPTEPKGVLSTVSGGISVSVSISNFLLKRLDASQSLI